MRSRIAVAAVVSLLLGAAAAGAGQDGRCEKLGEARIVFVGMAGRPIQRRMTPAHMWPEPVTTFVPMVVEHVFKGALPSELLLFAVPHQRPKPGDHYLIYGFELGDWAPGIIGVQDVLPVEQAAGDLEYLASEAGRSPLTTLQGAVRQLPDRGPESLPLPNVRYQISADGFTAEGTTDGSGRFRVTAVPPGEVQMHLRLPPGLTVVHPSTLTRTLLGGGCVPWYFDVRPDGRVSGRVSRSDGAPLARAMVDLVRVDGSGAGGRDGFRDWMEADEDGRFAFEGRPPGVYLLGVNLTRIESPQPLSPNVARIAVAAFPPTYFPGTTDREAATPIVIGHASSRDTLDFVVGAPLARSLLTVRVQAAPGAELSLCIQASRPDVGSRSRSSFPLEAADVVLQVIEGVHYRIHAHAIGREGYRESEFVEVLATAEHATVMMAATRASHTDDPQHSLPTRR